MRRRSGEPDLFDLTGDQRNDGSIRRAGQQRSIRSDVLRQSLDMRALAMKADRLAQHGGAAAPGGHDPGRALAVRPVVAVGQVVENRRQQRLTLYRLPELDAERGSAF